MPDGGTLKITTANVELDGREASLYPSIEPGRFVQLSVEDSGAGMDGEVAARAFEPFYTTKAQGEGTGLGLAIVYGIVTSAGGAVALSSEPGFGTLVTAHFPAVVAASMPGEDGDPENRDAPRRREGARRRGRSEHAPDGRADPAPFRLRGGDLARRP